MAEGLYSSNQISPARRALILKNRNWNASNLDQLVEVDDRIVKSY